MWKKINESLHVTHKINKRSKRWKKSLKKAKKCKRNICSEQHNVYRTETYSIHLSDTFHYFYTNSIKQQCKMWVAKRTETQKFHHKIWPKRRQKVQYTYSRNGVDFIAVKPQFQKIVQTSDKRRLYSTQKRHVCHCKQSGDWQTQYISVLRRRVDVRWMRWM